MLDRYLALKHGDDRHGTGWHIPRFHPEVIEQYRSVSLKRNTLMIDRGRCSIAFVAYLPVMRPLSISSPNIRCITTVHREEESQRSERMMISRRIRLRVDR